MTHAINIELVLNATDKEWLTPDSEQYDDFLKDLETLARKYGYKSLINRNSDAPHNG